MTYDSIGDFKQDYPRIFSVCGQIKSVQSCFKTLNTDFHRQSERVLSHGMPMQMLCDGCRQSCSPSTSR